MATIDIERTVSLDEPLKPETWNGVAFTAEAGAHRFIITVTKSGEEVALTGSVAGLIVLANGTSYPALAGSIENGKAVLTLTAACYEVPGRFQLVIVNISGNVKTGVYACTGTIVRADTDSQFDPGEAIPSAAELAVMIEACQNATTAATEAASHAVQYSAAQELTEAQKWRGRENIDAMAGSSAYESAVRYVTKPMSPTGQSARGVTWTINGRFVTMNGTATGATACLIGKTQCRRVNGFAAGGSSSTTAGNELHDNPTEYVWDIPAGHRILTIWRLVSGSITHGGTTYTPETGYNNNASTGVRLFKIAPVPVSTSDGWIVTYSGIAGSSERNLSTVGEDGWGPLLIYAYTNVVIDNAVFELVSYDLDADGGDLHALLLPEIETVVPTYSPLASYAAGAYVIKGRRIYRALSSVSAGTAWDSSKWQQTTVATALSDLDNAITSIVEAGSNTGSLWSDAGEYIYMPHAAVGTVIKSMHVMIRPNQSGSGVPSSDNVRPFTARGAHTFTVTGENILRPTITTTTVSGITFALTEDGKFTVKGTSTASSGDTSGAYVGSAYLKAGCAYFIAAPFYEEGVIYPRIDIELPGGTSKIYPLGGQVLRATVSGNYKFRVLVNGGKTVDKTIIPRILLYEESAYDSDGIDIQYFTYSLTEHFDSFYAGEAIHENGVVTIKRYPHYASYAGEALSGEWVSDRDVYVAGATPTTGAEVIDLSGTADATVTIDEGPIYLHREKSAVNPYFDYVKSIKYYADPAADKSMFIPSYYKHDAYLLDKVRDIRNAMAASQGNFDAFIFISDLHWDANAQRSPALIKYITDRLPIRTLVGGGDYDDGVNMTAMAQLRKSFPGCIYLVMGNHDYKSGLRYPNTPNGVAATMTDGVLSSYYNGFERDIVYGDRLRNYFYADISATKTRYIVLNVYGETDTWTFETETAQQTWLRDVALGTMPEGYTALIFAHEIVYCHHTTGAISWTAATGAIIKQIVDSYSGSGHIAGLFAGHRHWDSVAQTDTGVPVFTTTCDKYAVAAGWDDWLGVDSDGHVKRAKNTRTEQAFDVVVIDKTNSKVTAVRIGSPADNVGGDALEVREHTYPQ